MRHFCKRCRKFHLKCKEVATPVTITKPQWGKIKYGTYLVSSTGVIRKNLSKKRGWVVFMKLRPSRYDHDTTTYIYHDLCHSYRIYPHRFLKTKV